jgi:hypothetical protein
LAQAELSEHWFRTSAASSAHQTNEAQGRKRQPGKRRSIPATVRSMQKLKFIGKTIVNFVKQAWLFPRSFGISIKQRRQQITLDECEAERLDRLRNPSNYRGR